MPRREGMTQEQLKARRRRVLRGVSKNSQQLDALAKELDVPEWAVKNDIKLLEENGSILGYRAIINHEKGYPLLTFIIVELAGADDTIREQLIRKLAAHQSVEELHFFVEKSFGVLVKLRTDTVEETEDFKHAFLTSENGVSSATVIRRYETLKEAYVPRIPLE